MDLIQAIILGIVQGLTEFLPISSTAHLRLVPSLLGWKDAQGHPFDPGSAFTAVIQLGTLLAVLIYFRKDLASALGGWIRGLRGGEAAKTLEARLGWAIVIGTIPIVILGIVFKHQIETQFRSLDIIAYSLIAMGLLLLAADYTGKQTRKLEDVKPIDGLILGLWQALALVPGMSRSGSTITGGLFAGFNRAAAARFSFLLAVPSILGAALYELFKHRQEFGGDLLLPAVVANVFSFVVGYWSIGFLMKFLQNHRVVPFVIYRVGLGLIILFLVHTGRLDAMAGVQTDAPI
ncbi:MAG: undecaprenyl-diphosphatase, partial [Fimbriimonadaceae bacterium]|nr:undecaprenyl-diphosphatase [Fimbriimonadaceae bacterium]